MSEEKITIHNVKSNFYREVHVDGVFGGLTTRGLLSFSFYSERFPIPKASDFEIKNNQLGAHIGNSIDSKIGVVRNYEFGVYMDLNVTKSLVKLLQDKIAELEKIQKIDSNESSTTK